MKSVADMKQGLAICIKCASCDGCPYQKDCIEQGDCSPMLQDIGDYVRQLESKVDELEISFAKQATEAECYKLDLLKRVEEVIHRIEPELSNPIHS